MLVAVRAEHQIGCVEPPEKPTVILLSYDLLDPSCRTRELAIGKRNAQPAGELMQLFRCVGSCSSNFVAIAKVPIANITRFTGHAGSGRGAPATLCWVSFARSMNLIAA
jgi:hypothetical protein